MPRSPEMQRQARARRYQEYLAQLELTGAQPQWHRWGTHLSELKSGLGERGDLESPAQLRRWWLNNYTLAQIQELAAGIESLR